MITTRNTIERLLHYRPPRTRSRNGNPTMRVGDRVKLIVSDNAALHLTSATIVKLEEWGAHVAAPAAATGRFRALWSEMELVQSEYTGDSCSYCGSLKMRRAGACLVCEDCGESGGCS